ncbi:MAG: MFS transporter [Alphaproteobacteria bacterium]|nr:MFS transporter [Alphaproteobacteria bacterium]
MKHRRLAVVAALGTTQTVAWASSYYLPAILADPMARELGVPSSWIFAAVSASLILSALLGPKVGRQIDLFGGRPVLSASSLILAAGLTLLALTQSVPMMTLAWFVLGVGMALGLYDSAFAALGRIYGTDARGPITGITLMAGFASTIGWPLTALGIHHIGWRETCFAWAAVHLLLCLPLNFFVLPPVARNVAATSVVKPKIPIDRTMILLGFVFAAGWTVTGAMAAHFPRILESAGASPGQAIAAGALIGPAQVVARIIEAGLLSRYHPLLSTRLACITHPIGAGIVALFGGSMAGVFALFHGAGTGILTIARGTLPLAIFGPKDYGYRLGLIGAPARLAQAIAPLAFGMLIDVWGPGVLMVSSLISLAALAALFGLRSRHAIPAPPL